MIKHPQGKAKPYGEWKAEQDGQWTVRGAIRAAMILLFEVPKPKRFDMSFIICIPGLIRHILLGFDRFFL